MENNDRKYWVALSNYTKFGPAMFERLLNYFDSMEEAFKASLAELRSAGIPEKTAEGFVHLRSEIDVEALWAQIERNNVTVLLITDDAYPPLLKTIYDPPPLLYIRGNLPAPEVPHLAVVGSRKATPYGIRVTRDLTEELAEAGVVIVSGLAYGIDEAAHSATMTGKGVTLAILGCGLGMLNSRGRHVAQKIVEGGGAVISEFPIKMGGLRHNFPIRNRIISGMSHGTLVIEAAIKSGSLITAKSALEQAREVFAIPGQIYSETSSGTNQLIKDGAHLVTCAEDILSALQVERIEANALPPLPPANKEEASILELLSKNPIHIDELTRQTDLNASQVASTLGILEIKGRTRQIGGMYYILV
ncbi:DNA-protecting protein DprA [Candidatus Uhrbacteria bacterium CG_4_10_14_0_2_um_filter_41_7]|uniref:DNA-protecting protein DprA n=1 Tax=Candidatus Uhrbacteria bacterium CG_4_9_14_3_um_filter_41_35 TaxID=1975034 RepID=A0A2M7XG02_9BACT|nr:MAG: DNA-protecting protein DprA [Candidatus Uhrbacteria bacterium CG11_big_fil_rev_8_21_14_0_20_41_9]PIZ54321.1 MAG: DNA-protecting protein DprA [Candidatus Uhrbacteria bacterium CG_4_10_14_0_2_um_filter_41_7]PJA46803.1 MAG: DNA-protecting protein DprA [Candidatus Uhrbacteria bacterium CG_4_9_14_3_um_filter_41_35]